jgi:hypothetical protein
VRATTLPALCPSPRRPSLDGAAPRLLDLDAAERYLGGLSPTTVRTMLATGVLRRVRVALSPGVDVRRVLVDRLDLDALIERWKDGTP